VWDRASSLAEHLITRESNGFVVKKGCRVDDLIKEFALSQLEPGPFKAAGSAMGECVDVQTSLTKPTFEHFVVRLLLQAGQDTIDLEVVQAEAAYC